MEERNNVEGNENGKKNVKSAVKSVVITILTLFLPIILIAAIFLTIIQGIIDIICGIVDGIIGFLKDPVAWVASAARGVGNGVSYLFNGEHWEPEAPSCTFTYILNEEQLETIKKQIEAGAIDLKQASLTDEVLKKMILVNYMTMSTEDTEIAIPISKDEYDNRHNTSNAFKYKVGDENWRSKWSVLYVC